VFGFFFFVRSVKDGRANIVCGDAGGDPARVDTHTSMAERFATAFNDLWRNPTYGSHTTNRWKNSMNDLIGQLKGMFDEEKNGIAAKKLAFANNQAKLDHYGSEYYESLGGAVTGMLQDYVNHYLTPWSTSGKGRSEGNVRALQFNDDHFSWY
jgi:hypothetical protein